MTAWYNENDEYAADWLEELIRQKIIAPGVVDRRSIVDVRASDLKGFDQCHFFAGIGGWSLALRGAGWPDNRKVWTGSCPCQPYSNAGSKKEFDDERDLWPAWFGLIRIARPSRVYGEQVASAEFWLDRVRANLENEAYTFGAALLPACGVDAPHKRDRLWIVAGLISDAEGGESWGGLRQGGSLVNRNGAASGRSSDRGNDVVDSNVDREKESGPILGGGQQRGPRRNQGARGGDRSRDVVDSPSKRRRQGKPTTEIRERIDGAAERPSGRDNVDDAIGARSQGHAGNGDSRERRPQASRSVAASSRVVSDASDGQFSESLGGAQRGNGPRSTGSFWAGAQWAAGADGKARRIEPSIRLLADGVLARASKLRGYGNAIVHQVGTEFIIASEEAFDEIRKA